MPAVFFKALKDTPLWLIHVLVKMHTAGPSERFTAAEVTAQLESERVRESLRGAVMFAIANSRLRYRGGVD